MLKIIYLPCLAFLLGMTNPGRVAAWEGPAEERVVPVRQVSVPSDLGPDSNVVVVASGNFPNSCYRMGRVNVRHVGARAHEVALVASVFQGVCLMTLVPFHQEVRLGKLVEGTHALRFANGDGTFWERRFTVAPR